MSELQNDILRGADEIAAVLYGDKRLRRRVYHLAATQRLPVFRLGQVICARRSKLLAWIEKQEEAATAGTASSSESTNANVDR